MLSLGYLSSDLKYRISFFFYFSFFNSVNVQLTFKTSECGIWTPEALSSQNWLSRSHFMFSFPFYSAQCLKPLEPEIVCLQKSFFYAPGQSNITACTTQSLLKSLVLMLLSLSTDLMSPSDRMFWQFFFLFYLTREVHWWEYSLCLHSL